MHATHGTGFEVEIGSCAVTRGDSDLFIPHLASGLAVCVHDGGEVAGLAYALRGRSTPDERAAVLRPATFVDLALPELALRMDERGARPERAAILVGGAVGPGWRRPRSTADEAIAVARALLAELGVPVVHEILGGSLGRMLVLNGHGRLRIDDARLRGQRFGFVASAAQGGTA
jgi:chemotaxis receptor (MCP) glutamine deamidase CheD